MKISKAIDEKILIDIIWILILVLIFFWKMRKNFLFSFFFLLDFDWHSSNVVGFEIKKLHV